ncbi:MAG TPA: lipoprotein insertase outer membrane protein LolB [Ideonella sp.]|uniref:lipoprotein insertase outer membrane protein LolB n=1 Tax=Ideonella sp. TaxID=1929293 RepID=UPI002C5A2BDE|nr:lipoprotein insertase outer membrane protein LolB [Ideonella sp.]HSI48951.1 lipoprotein insertase outer membrane protein LolB [Ideonella sp.]
MAASGLRTCLLAAAMLLAGCVTAPPAPTDLGPATTGRMVVRVAATANQIAKAENAAFELAGTEQQGRLKLLSPLGTVVADAHWQAGQVTLQTGDGTRQFDSMEALASETLGEAIPLGALLHWLAGKPWPQAPAQPTAQGFEQAGWQVDTSALGKEGLLQARRPAAPALELRVKLDR